MEESRGGGAVSHQGWLAGEQIIRWRVYAKRYQGNKQNTRQDRDGMGGGRPRGRQSYPVRQAAGKRQQLPQVRREKRQNQNREEEEEEAIVKMELTENVDPDRACHMEGVADHEAYSERPFWRPD
ncbi:hypothetical protein An15g04460 [Aspergillus niger]|uniref:Uncharacterized protein n=2 Tax=Aspergillus niger TaxID=5061 RepID=A2R5I8_ASPNC|nr:hypothetical protein An15g04460 [Aspergillus niger]CAK97313.1 hypothetical protein An15g04460 [Aspergillus niger]